MKHGEQPGPSDDRGRRAVTEDENGDADTNAQLRAMRSVWLSMRDEDPPDGGLVDLLAAARAKAATMRAQPTLWQRVLAVLRRPPALAFATVVVLVGGAVLVVGRGSGDRSSDLAAGSSGMLDEPSRRSKVSAHEPAITAGTSSTRAAPDGEGPGAERDKATIVVGAAAAAAETPQPTEAPMGTGGASATAERVKAVNTTRRPGPRPPGDSAAGAGREPPAPRPTSTETGIAATPRPTATETGVAAAPPSGERASRSSERRGAGLDQLYRQCSSAARRGDCAAVRRLVAQIKQQDRAYRGQLAKDAAVGKCLASEASEQPEASRASE